MHAAANYSAGLGLALAAVPAWREQHLAAAGLWPGTARQGRGVDGGKDLCSRSDPAPVPIIFGARWLVHSGAIGACCCVAALCLPCHWPRPWRRTAQSRRLFQKQGRRHAAPRARRSGTWRPSWGRCGGCCGGFVCVLPGLWRACWVGAALPRRMAPQAAPNGRPRMSFAGQLLRQPAPADSHSPHWKVVDPGGQWTRRLARAIRSGVPRQALSPTACLPGPPAAASSPGLPPALRDREPEKAEPETCSRWPLEVRPQMPKAWRDWCASPTPCVWKSGMQFGTLG